MKVSVCMASFNRDPHVLRQVLESIFSQHPPFEFEVIVADDGSDCGAPEVCGDFPVEYLRIERQAAPRNGSVAHNVAYRHATGDIIIAQSDDVVHQDDSIEVLCKLLEENPLSCIFATVFGCDPQGKPNSVYTGVWEGPRKRMRMRMRRRKPYFFLGAVYRADLYAVGGDDEDFERSGGTCWEDVWLGDCLMNGLGLNPVYTKEVHGLHLHHATRWTRELNKINEKLYEAKVKEAESTGVWCSSGGPWKVADV